MSYTKNELLNYWDKNGFECLEDIKDLQGMTFVPFVGAGILEKSNSITDRKEEKN